MTPRIGIAVVVLALAVPASAQQLKMSFNAGKVSLDATQVPVRTILAEWAKLGGTKVVNGEKVAGAPLTLKIVDMPEAQALDIILRNVAGYMAAPRAAAAAGPSFYDRILVMPTSSAPAAASASATPNIGRPGAPPNQPNGGTQRFVPQRQIPGAEDAPEQPEEANENPPQPVFTFPQPQPGTNIFQPAGQQPGNIFQPVGQPTPFGTPMAPGAMPPQPGAISINPAPNQPGTMVYPGQPTPNGFGIFGAPSPGMVQQPPQPPNQPGVTVIRPPGR